jgi:hypothetical protein
MTDFSHDLSALLGRSIDDAEVRTFFAHLDDRVPVTMSRMEEPRWIAYSVGMEVHAALPSRRITTVFTYAEKTQDRNQKQYRGELPHGLGFALSREQVLARMNTAPDKSSTRHDAWVFETYYLAVQYDKTGKIHTIGVSGNT